MRSLTQLKESENKQNPRSPIVRSEVKTPLSVKNKAVLDDPLEIGYTSLLAQNETLKKLAKERREEIDQLDKDITKRIAEIDDLTDEKIKKATRYADEIISDANSKKTDVEGMLAQAKVLEFNAKAKNKELDGLIDKIEKRLEVVEASERSIKRNKAEVIVQLNEAKEKTVKSGDLLNRLTIMFLTALRYTEAIGKISDDFLDTISQNIEKTDKMYQQVIQIQEQNKAKELINIEKADELDIKQNWLLDREKTISRTEKEVKRRI